MIQSLPPLQQRLVAAAVALIVMLVLTALVYVTQRTLGGWMTPLGLIAPLDLLAVAVSMAMGGAIARRDFRRWAVLLVVVAGVASAVTAYAYAPPTPTSAAHWLLRNTALQLVLSAGVAWLAAWAGESIRQRIEARRYRTRAAAE